MATPKSSRRNRDANGWRVPREGTVARRVYDLTQQQIDPLAISERIGRSPNYVAVVLWKIRNADAANRLSVASAARVTGRQPERSGEGEARAT